MKNYYKYNGGNKDNNHQNRNKKRYSSHNYRQKQHRCQQHSGYHKTNSAFYSNHPEHPTRDAIYSVFSCFDAIGFALLWLGLAYENSVLLIIGIVTAVTVTVTAIYSFTKSFVKYKKYKA